MLEFIVNIEADRDESVLQEFAFALARQHSAFLTGIHVVVVDATIIASPGGKGVLDDEESAARGRREWWNDLCLTHHVDGQWEVLRGFFQSVMARRASFSDLILGRLSTHRSDALLGLGLISRIVFSDVVPILLVPETWPRHDGVKKVVIAWNGSAEAARAAKAALPLLRHAEQIIVLDGEQEAFPLLGNAHARLPLRAWLERQGLSAQWHPMNPPPTLDMGELIHQRVMDLDADLLVMGAWGHSRMSELLMGGVTRYMLRNAQLPVLYAH
jgi:nucleotide-binding universal stress UspA family protein